MYQLVTVTQLQRVHQATEETHEFVVYQAAQETHELVVYPLLKELPGEFAVSLGICRNYE